MSIYDHLDSTCYHRIVLILQLLLVALLSLQVGCIVAACILLPRYVARQKAQIADAARAFVSSPDDQTPSPLAAIADQCALLLVGRAQQAIETRMRGAAGAAARDEGKAEVAAALAQGPSWLPVLASFLPKRYLKLLAANPQFLGQLPLNLGGNGNGQHAPEYTGRKHRD